MKRRSQDGDELAPLLLTIPQVTVMLGLYRSKIYDFIEHQGLPTVKRGLRLSEKFVNVRR